MRLEYNKLIKEKELDNSVRFSRKMLMAFVTASEYLNNRYDPMSIQLDGWSDQVLTILQIMMTYSKNYMKNIKVLVKKCLLN